MKYLFSNVTVILFCVFCASVSKAQVQSASQTCDGQLVQRIQKMISSELKKNGEFVLSLFDRSLAGELKCQVASTKVNYVSLEMCGFTAVSVHHHFKMSTKNQSWELSVDQVDVSCGTPGFWLKKISSAHGNIGANIVSGNRIISQVRGCGVETAVDYKAVVFANGELDGQGRAVQIINTDASKACAVPYTANDSVIEFSAQALGLTSDLTQILIQKGK